MNDTLINYLDAVGPGWEQILRDADAQIAPLAFPDFYYTDVKEKFGGLRIYTSYSTPDIDSIIDAAEALSLKTCESCGAPGRARTGKSGWITTECKRCWEEEH